MTVARRLQGALVVFVLLIAAVVALQVRSIQSAAASSHALAGISERQRIVSTDQVGRIERMRDDIERFLVTGDAAYLARVTATGAAFERGLTRLDSASLTRPERVALVRITTQWQAVRPLMAILPGLTSRRPAVIDATISRLQASLEQVEEMSRALGTASQDAMTTELRAVERDARNTELVALTAATIALLLMVLLSAHLVRTIVGPIGRLADGTRQVSAGRFDHRLDASGEDELARVARDFNAMAARLGELDRLKREFVANVSHDLKTPLSSMEETIAAMLDGMAGPLSDGQRRLLELNLESNRRLAAMLSKLLDLSRIEARLEPTREVIDLRQVAGRLAEQAMASAAGPRVVVEDQGPPWTVSGDQHALGQVIANVVENAIKFSPPGGTVVVRGTTSRGAVVLSVADEGPGIPDAEKERIFERFYQTAAGRAVRSRGAGLGLAICREIVSAHGGRIWVEDNAPRGSVFRIKLSAAVGEKATGRVTRIRAGTADAAVFS